MRIGDWSSDLCSSDLIALYLLFLFRSVKIVVNSPKAFGALLAAALSFSLVIQAFANMAVATNLFTVTGVSLPLVSMGGTSILFKIGRASCRERVCQYV